MATKKQNHREQVRRLRRVLKNNRDITIVSRKLLKSRYGAGVTKNDFRDSSKEIE